ncbi:MAG: hypothetical protein LCI00_08395 [Chloroflexi bacterium]|nr:hypothetical protein [Chloroflexota bacterium]
MKPERLSDEQQNITENGGINLLSLYRSMLRIVARLDESEYTEDNSLLRQTEVFHHPDLADPASDEVTLQG